MRCTRSAPPLNAPRLRAIPSSAAAPAFEAPRRPEFGDFATNVALQLAKVAKRTPQDVALALIEDVRAAAPELRVAFRRASMRSPGSSTCAWRRTSGRARSAKRSSSATISADCRATASASRSSSAARTRPGRWWSCKAARSRSATRSRARSASRVRRLRRVDHQRRRLADGHARALALRALPSDRRHRSFRFPKTAIRATTSSRSHKRFASATATSWRSAPESEWLAVLREVRARRTRRAATAHRRALRRALRSVAERERAARRRHDRDGVDRLRELGLTYEKDGAVWLRATDFGDDKDRVVMRSDGRPTYFAHDVAYHYRQTAARRPRDRHPRPRSSRLHRPPARH